MKPDWKDAPKWATHLTLDPDGSWYWHDQKPEYTPYGWASEYHIFAGTQQFEPVAEERP